MLTICQLIFIKKAKKGYKKRLIKGMKVFVKKKEAIFSLAIERLSQTWKTKAGWV